MAAFKFRQRRTRRWWYAGATLVVAALFSVFYVVGAGAVVTGSPSHFESQDGNMVLNTAGNTDWNCFSESDNFAHNGAAPATGCATKTGATQVTADQVVTGKCTAAPCELTWVNGQKFDTACPALSVGSVPNKDDFTHVAEYQETNTSTNDRYFYGAALRLVSNGNASGDVEFNQASGNGTTSAGCRTAGDRLIAYDFTGGGQTPLKLVFHVLTWITSDNPGIGQGGNTDGACFVKTDKNTLTNGVGGCWGAVVFTPDNTTFDGAANASPIAAADNGISNEALDVQQLAEFGINLTLALTGQHGGALPCFPQQVWESRSSGSSFTSSPEDIEFAHLTTCGAISILKTSSKAAHTPLSGAHFQICTNNGPYTTQNPCSAAKAGSDDLVTGDDGTVCVDNLAQGSFYVSEKSAPAGYAVDDTSIHNVSAQNGATCSGGTTPTPLTFRDTPKTDLTVHVASEASGGTQSSITCTGPSPGTGNIGNSPQPASGFGDPETMTANGLAPGTYTCTVVIDP